MLYIVATPIGNLKDITLRALETLKDSDLILCEDTRQAMKLLLHYKIEKRTLSYHEHSNEKRVSEILSFLKSGKKVSLVCDAGTPGISDPGGKIIKEAIENGIKVVPVPGPSALTCAISVSGIPMDKFLFMGFPPIKNKRNKFFKQVSDSVYPVVLYESSHRILKTLKDLGDDSDVIVFREMTKIYETIYRGKVRDILNRLEARGEFVIVVVKRIV